MKAETTSAPKIAAASNAGNASNGRTRKTSKKVETIESFANAPAQAADEVAARVHGTPTREQIAQRAYELYLARGSVDGHAAEDWLQAERELS